MAEAQGGVYRAPMRSRDDAVERHAGVERALELGLCGTGGRLPDQPADLLDAVAATERAHGERVARRLRRFADVSDGSVVWTRDSAERFHRGVLTGPWRYDASAGAAAVDLVHVRPCSWVAVQEVEVPEAVIASFARGGRNFQRIRAL